MLSNTAYLTYYAFGHNTIGTKWLISTGMQLIHGPLSVSLMMVKALVEVERFR
jgi:hypothetical protein